MVPIGEIGATKEQQAASIGVGPDGRSRLSRWSSVNMHCYGGG